MAASRVGHTAVVGMRFLLPTAISMRVAWQQAKPLGRWPMHQEARFIVVALPAAHPLVGCQGLPSSIGWMTLCQRVPAEHAFIHRMDVRWADLSPSADEASQNVASPCRNKGHAERVCPCHGRGLALPRHVFALPRQGHALPRQGVCLATAGVCLARAGVLPCHGTGNALPRQGSA